MLTINYQAWVRGPTAHHSVWIIAKGTTPDEVKADAERQRKAIGAIESGPFGMMASGIKNRESDWIAVFGNNHSPDSTFMDTPEKREEPRKSFLQRIFS